MARNPPLARQVVQTIIANTSIDPFVELLYNPLNWRFPNNTDFPATFDWLEPPVNKIINGRHDAFTLRCERLYAYPSKVALLSLWYRMADICQPFDMTPPDTPLFDPKKTAIVSNGR